MAETSRRRFLSLLGMSAAGVGAASVAGAAGAESTAVPSGAAGPLVAYVRDARSGRVAVMAGEREVVVHDRRLAARIARVLA